MMGCQIVLKWFYFFFSFTATFEASSCSISLPTFGVVSILILAILLGVYWCLILVLICISLMTLDGETVEIVADFIFLGSKITADGDYSHEIKRCLLLGRKVMTNLDSILKGRDYFANKGCLVKAMVFPVVIVWM